jgi:hypothetical protein
VGGPPRVTGHDVLDGVLAPLSAARGDGLGAARHPGRPHGADGRRAPQHPHRRWSSGTGPTSSTFSDAETLVRHLPNGRLLEADSVYELRLRPRRLTDEIASFLDECWMPQRAGQRRRAASA